MSENPLNRRDVLQSTAAIAGLGSVSTGVATASSCNPPDESGDFSEKNFNTEISTGDLKEGVSGNYEYGLETRGVLAHDSSDYVNGVYLHRFYTSSVSVANRKLAGQSKSEYEAYPDCAGHSLEIDASDPNQSLFTSSDTDEVGGFPAESSYSGIELGNSAFSLMLVALSTSGYTPVLTASLSAANAVLGMIDGGRNLAGASNDVEYLSWGYGNDSCCVASNFCKFYIESDDGYSSASVDVTHTGAPFAAGQVPPQTNEFITVDPEGDGGDGGCGASETCLTDVSPIRPQLGTTEYEYYLERSDKFKKMDPDSLDYPDELIGKTDSPAYKAKDPSVVVENSSS
ncbi:MAG: hypothetical protein V5A34_07745 [Halapricum sp.]